MLKKSGGPQDVSQLDVITGSDGFSRASNDYCPIGNFKLPMDMSAETFFQVVDMLSISALL
ncbi:MAG TPA: hypothetical protein VLK78_02530 [Candidatus Angelobacter sp.]|nr:hypothetical protein [Candidatus Angelobacter sp.]